MENRFNTKIVIRSLVSGKEVEFDLSNYDNYEDLEEEFIYKFDHEERMDLTVNDILSDIDLTDISFSSIEDVFNLIYKLDKLDYNDNEILAYSEVLDINDLLNNQIDMRLHDSQFMADVAYEYILECYNIPAYIMNYIDFDRLGDDMSINGTFYETSYGILEIY